MLAALSEEPRLADVITQQRELLSRMRAVVEAKDAENAALRASDCTCLAPALRAESLSRRNTRQTRKQCNRSVECHVSPYWRLDADPDTS